MSKNPRTKSGPKFYNRVQTRQQLARLVQLRTGHCSLNQYLHRFHIIDDPTCTFGCTIETVSHYLIHCENYERERDKLRRKVGARGMRIETLLGDPKHIKPLLEFVEETKRFTF